DGENYSLTITSVGANEFEAVDFSDEATNTVTTTIDSNNAGDSANEGGLDSNDVVYIKLTGDDSQIEADNAALTHTLSLVDADGQPVTLLEGQSIEVTLSYTRDGTDADDFSSVKQTTVTIIGNAAGISSTDIINRIQDDLISEGDESYTLTITNVVDTNGSFEKLSIDNQNSV
ncbi:hypothetical protein CXF56_14030, partial [Psychrobacter sp. Choline-02u-13]